MLDGREELNDFNLWLAGATWFAYRSDSEADALSGQIVGTIADWESDVLTDEELRSE